MSTTTSTAPAQITPREGTLAVVALLVIGAIATVAGAVAGNGNPLFALVPAVGVAALAVTWVAPLRIPLLVTLFLSLALDATDEGPWNSPLAKFGYLLSANLNKSLPIGFLAFPGIALILGLLVVIHAHRVLRGATIDGVTRRMIPGPSLQALAVSLAAVVWLCLLGLKRGGDMQMAKLQVTSYVLLLLVAYLSAMSFRGMRDYKLLGGVILAAACIKSVYALFVVMTVKPPFELSNGRLAFATTHGESLLFALAAVMVIVWFAERPQRQIGILCAVTLPLLIAGMHANNRRLVWVQVAACLALFWVMSRRSQLKRIAAYALLASTPLIFGYIAVGWNSKSSIFAPIQTFRSVGDGNVDASTLYRDLENYNLLMTMRANPMLGTGFGHPFAEIVKLPDISFFKEYRYMPHNSILGLWAFCGPFGFSGLMVALVAGIFFAVRSYSFARDPDTRTVAFTALAAILIFLIHCWGDIGFAERKSIFLVGPALAIAGQLTISTGAWRRAVAPSKPRGVR